MTIWDHNLSVGVTPDGTILYKDDKSGRTIVLRSQYAPDGRNEIVELHIENDGRSILTSHLRSIPLGRLEAFTNSPHYKQMLKAANNAR